MHVIDEIQQEHRVEYFIGAKAGRNWHNYLHKLQNLKNWSMEQKNYTLKDQLIIANYV